MVYHWSLCDSKSPQVSRTLLSILVDHNNAVVWMVSTCPLIFMSSNPCINPLVTILRAPVTIDITVTFMFHRFFSSLARSLCVGKKGLCPLEFGARFEKSASELKLKQKLLKCKHTIQIETFNVRTLNRISQLPKLTASVIDHNIEYVYKNTDTFIVKILNIMILAMDGC